MKYVVGDRIVTKKKHVCGNDIWLVERIGAEVRIKCTKCEREVMMLKMEFDKRIKNIITKSIQIYFVKEKHKAIRHLYPIGTEDENSLFF